MCEILIETPHSSLKVHRIENVRKMEKLMKKCILGIEGIEGNIDEYPEIFIMGRRCIQKRCVGFFSNSSEGYQYSGQIARSKPLTDELQFLLDRINLFFESNYNGILVNKYNNGEDYIGSHSDDQRYLDPNSGVVILSYGASRIFRIRDKKTNEKVLDFETSNDTIIQMCGNFQMEFKHEIPQQKRVKDVRYSFTFRHHQV